MSINYFANGNKLSPGKNGANLPVVQSITGFFMGSDIRPRKDNRGFWLIMRLKTEGDYINVYFDFESGSLDSSESDRLESMKKRTVTISSKNEKPVMDAFNIESEGDIRAELLRGVAAGNVKIEDLPALIEFSMGKVDMFEKWSAFKLQNQYEDIKKVKAELLQRTSVEQKSIERKRDELGELYEIDHIVNSERNRILDELSSSLILIQGEDDLQGTERSMSSGHKSENLVCINDGYNSLHEAFQKLKPKKGVYVISGDKIHKIHHAYIDDKGRAFLIGTAKEFLRTRPEEAKKLVDMVIHATFPERFSL